MSTVEALKPYTRPCWGAAQRLESRILLENVI